MLQPDDLIPLAARRASTGDAREHSVLGFEAVRIAAEYPHLLIPFLRALRPIGANVKRWALDDVGQRLAAAGLPTPTLAECREALAADFQAHRHGYIAFAAVLPHDIGRRLVPLAFEALGHGDEAEAAIASAIASTEGLGEPIDPDKTPTERHHVRPELRIATRDWSFQSTSCTVQVEREDTFVDATADQGPEASSTIKVKATHRDGSKLAVDANVGGSSISFVVNASARASDQMHMTLWRAFANKTKYKHHDVMADFVWAGCPICRDLPSIMGWCHSMNGERTGGPFPDATQQFIQIGDLWKCPTCVTYYEFERDHDNGVPDGWDSEYLKRLTLEDARTLMQKMPSPPTAELASISERMKTSS